jgi:hypothetical protein
MARKDFSLQESRVMRRVVDTLVTRVGMPRRMAERIAAEHMREERMARLERHAATMMHAVCRG